ncbi:conjugal transfer protein TraG [Pedobacter kyungheensis]|uniref:Conjugal transfer protein TraG n=1 Tax=Pedobacter kyungheensis TaxID=1069985 RepID=A0A0C1FGY1_9SPHI|nr:TraG family conjugative transposon ATPase [Pedobacter kyungheensis]KIA92242.1 conjugal transfer protein TraG [Pedobacter kyungheensis]
MMEIEKILPVWKVESDCMVSMSGDVTIAYRVSLPETGTLSPSSFDVAQQAFVKAIRVLPAGVVFHKADYFFKSKVKADFESASASVLSFASEGHFNERPFLDHECYLFLTLLPRGRKLSSSAYSNILRKSIAPAGRKDEVLLKNFFSAVGSFERILSDSGLFALARLGDNELSGTANLPGIIERYLFLLGKGESSMLRDVHLKEGIRVGDKQVQLFTLADAKDLPGICGSRIDFDAYSTERTKYSIGFASPLGLFLDCNHIYNQLIFTGDPQRTIKELEAKKLRLQSLSAYSRENAVSRDFCNDFLNEAVVTQKLPVKAHFNVLCWTDEASGLTELKNKVGSAMAKMDAVCRQETDGAPQVWFGCMPGNEGDFPMNDTFDTFAEQACCFLNMETAYRSSLSPFGIRLGDRLSGVPLHVDISDEPMKLGWTTNRSKFIIGPSGSGKSFFTNHLMRSYYEQGAHVVIVDIGHSYKGLCDLLGGYYFTYSGETPICFNPFYIAEGDVLDTEKKESIKTLLLALWKNESESYTRAEYVAVSNALTLYYEYLATNPSVFPCFNSFYDFLMQEYLVVLRDGKVNPKDFNIDNFLYVLNPYYKGGEFDFLLNATEHLDLLKERFIVFEIDTIKSHPILFPVVTLIIMEMFIAKLRKLKGVRKVLLLEEVWKSISKGGMAEYIQYAYKTFRKFFGEPIVVTQEIEDIISSPIVKQAIINNSDCKILLDQSKYQNKFDTVQELLGLTDHDKSLILSMNKANDPKLKYKEVFISLGGHSKVYRTEVSVTEYLAYTTEEREKQKVQEYAAKYGSVARGIAVLAAELRSGKKVF